jgi:hypothetical protein
MAECVSTSTSFVEFYPDAIADGVNLTLPPTGSRPGGNYTCVSQCSDSRMFILGISLGGAFMVVGLVCHRCLPVQHPAIPYLDPALVALCYFVHVVAMFNTGFLHYLGRLYLLPSLQGGRVREKVRALVWTDARAYARVVRENLLTTHALPAAWSVLPVVVAFAATASLH